MTPVVEAQGVGVTLGAERVLSDVSFRIEAGEFVGIAGPNGGGKSTLLRALLGLTPTSAGEVRLFGTPLGDFREHARIGYVPQNAAHVETSFPATAREVVALGRIGLRGPLARLAPQRRREDAKAVEDAMRSVGVWGLEGRLIGRLSGGQRQRVLLAKALATSPDLLILDEPTTGVDPTARDEFAHLLMDLNAQRGMTVVLVSHDTDIIEHAAKRVLVIDRGLRMDATTAQERSSLAHLHGHGHGHAHGLGGRAR